jgi:holo-[acyl-carrier protein] synthase
LILGIGVDIIEVERVRRLRERYGPRFLSRILSPREKEQIHGDPDQYVAGRFAAKEAAMKALGTGWRRGVRWQDVEILNEASGRPVLGFRGEVSRRVRAMGARAHVSLSHLESLAVAVVILEDGGDAESAQA